MAEMKGITCCGDCVYYNIKKHKCMRGNNIETNPRARFYDDCPLPDVVPVVSIVKKHSIEEIREAIMRLHMCACRECEICKYKTDSKNKMPSEDCKERATRNMNILADEMLRGDKK